MTALGEHSNPALCAKCGGRCCQRAPGECRPQDFASATELAEKLASGRYGIDWWEGDPRTSDAEREQIPWPETGDGKAYFVRPAVTGREGRLFDASWGGKCTFLKSDGCALAPRNRPHGCRTLIPEANGECTYAHGDLEKRLACLEWLKTPLLDEALSALGVMGIEV